MLGNAYARVVELIGGSWVLAPKLHDIAVNPFQYAVLPADCGFCTNDFEPSTRIVTAAGGATYFRLPCDSAPAGTLPKCTVVEATGRRAAGACGDGPTPDGRCYLEATIDGGCTQIYLIDHDCGVQASNLGVPGDAGCGPLATGVEQAGSAWLAGMGHTTRGVGKPTLPYFCTLICRSHSRMCQHSMQRVLHPLWSAGQEDVRWEWRSVQSLLLGEEAGGAKPPTADADTEQRCRDVAHLQHLVVFII